MRRLHFAAASFRLQPAGPEHMPSWLKNIDHTGDAGMIVTAASLEQLFARAAEGMFSLITDVRRVYPQKRRRVRVEAPDREALLVHWLSELNVRHIIAEELYCGFRVLSLADTALRAEIAGEPIDLTRHEIFTEIKAVTFHDLSISQTAPGRWEARIIFDL